jgi:hypothetical protein
MYVASPQFRAIGDLPGPLSQVTGKPDWRDRPRAGRSHTADRRGVIPARAGSARLTRTFGASSGGHPRSRGEREPPYVVVEPLPGHPRSRGERPRVHADGRDHVGSSPLARGARHLRGDDEPDPRVIPARAGSAPPQDGAPHRRRGHPRSRGERRRADAVRAH